MSEERDGTAGTEPADSSAADAAVDDAASDNGAAVGSRSASGSAAGQARKVPMGKESVRADDAEAAADAEVVDGLADPPATAGDAERRPTAGSARAAARRSGVKTGTTPAKGVATRPRDADKKPDGGFFQWLRRFLREVVAELRKVIWPSRNQMVTYTIVVIVFVVFMVALVAGLDVLFARGVLWIFG